VLSRWANFGALILPKAEYPEVQLSNNPETCTEPGDMTKWLRAWSRRLYRDVYNAQGSTGLSTRDNCYTRTRRNLAFARQTASRVYSNIREIQTLIAQEGKLRELSEFIKLAYFIYCHHITIQVGLPTWFDGEASRRRLTSSDDSASLATRVNW
jgi:hypothetical protein